MFLSISIIGGLLSLLYSGTPCAMKHRALGDICIFFTFGPALAVYVALFLLIEKYSDAESYSQQSAEIRAQKFEEDL